MLTSPSASASTVSWNPLRALPAPLPVPALIAAKLTAFLLLRHGGLAVLSPTGLAVALLTLTVFLNRAIRPACFLLGALALLSSPQAVTTFAGCLLILLALWPRRFPAWPSGLIVIYDGDCGICRRIRHALSRVDFDHLFSWQPFQSGIGDRWSIPRHQLEQRLHLIAAGRITAGFRAVKLILLYNPAFLLLVGLFLIALPVDWIWSRRLAAAILFAFFFPAFNPIGERVYLWVARNRSRLFGATCGVDTLPR